MAKIFNEAEWLVKIGMIPATLDETEAYLSGGSLYTLPLIKERCFALAKAAGKSFVEYRDFATEVFEALTAKEIATLRNWVAASPERRYPFPVLPRA